VRDIDAAHPADTDELAQRVLADPGLLLLPAEETSPHRVSRQLGVGVVVGHLVATDDGLKVVRHDAVGD